MPWLEKTRDKIKVKTFFYRSLYFENKKLTKSKQNQSEDVFLPVNKSFPLSIFDCSIASLFKNLPYAQRWAERNLKRKAQLPQLAQLRKLRCAFILF